MCSLDDVINNEVEEGVKDVVDANPKASKNEVIDANPISSSNNDELVTDPNSIPTKPVRLTKREKREKKYLALKQKRKDQRLAGKKRSKRKHPPTDQLEANCQIGIEVLGGHELMSAREMRSLAQQIRYCYAANRVSPTPVNLVISNFQLIKDFIPTEAVNWKNVQMIDESITTTTNIPNSTTSQVIVLSADATETLTDLDPNTLYIIGGLVDRNRHKGYAEKVLGANFPTRKLPISLSLNSSTVLTTLHVFQILLSHHEGLTWPEAINRHIPERKRQEDPNTNSNSNTNTNSNSSQ
ncbi:tRNA (guanine9-N1)-methyltransferase [Nematocida homosporus]|uniref:tRNA (guanine9-N1)-methyltransferase n=1 Tax=Nematocida homosporus TaxID=1912981 RepID=UPI00221F9944|nr:tRNA (guanine9-N1)-methyltransferase [Nematocida homosporus]KAI5187893.1 tRNA (guanine9-N1)-methyltransferase [Nematocida homosporus]